MRAPQGSLRVFPEVRSSLIDDLNAESPRPTLFLKPYWEAASRELPSGWEQVTRLQALVRIWQAPPQTLELFEPLWFTHFPFWLALALTHRLRTAGSPVQRAFYGIENNDLEAIVPRGQRLGGLPTKIAARLLRFLIPRLVEKIAYGSAASMALYAPLTGPGLQTRLIPPLRASRLTTTPDKTAGTVAFVGPLHERKGLPLLMRAWERVEADPPGCRLTIIGGGPLAGEAERWAGKQPESRTFRGTLERAEVIELLTETALIAVPSQRWGHWREQINAAIEEALSVGCTVVTTTETGLAPWLQSQGHTVVEPYVSAEELGERITSALRSPLDPATVLASLPERDGRVTADLWLHALDAEPALWQAL